MKRFLVLGVVVAAFAAVPATSAWAANPHELNKNPVTCVKQGTAVSCSGSIAGLGNAVDAVIIQIDADAACATKRSGHQPGGHLQARTAPITVENGRVDFEDVTTAPASCPPGLRPVVGNTATVSVIDAATNEVIVSFEVNL